MFVLSSTTLVSTPAFFAQQTYFIQWNSHARSSHWKGGWRRKKVEVRITQKVFKNVYSSVKYGSNSASILPNSFFAWNFRQVTWPEFLCFTHASNDSIYLQGVMWALDASNDLCNNFSALNWPRKFTLNLYLHDKQQPYTGALGDRLIASRDTLHQPNPLLAHGHPTTGPLGEMYWLVWEAG